MLTPAQTQAAGDLALLGAARDLFAANEHGQHYLRLYDTHASETGRLAVEDPTLARDAYELLQDYLPGIAALVSGEGHRVVISQRLIDRTNALADRLTGAGSPELAAAIAAERARYNNLQDFAGLTFAEAAARIGLPVPARFYLPVIAH